MFSICAVIHFSGISNAKSSVFLIFTFLRRTLSSCFFCSTSFPCIAICRIDAFSCSSVIMSFTVLFCNPEDIGDLLEYAVDVGV